MAARVTFLAPGQRYADPVGPDWLPDHQFTVVHVGGDGLGSPRVTCRLADGDLLVLPAALIEAAVAAGQFVPVVGAGLVARAA
jgi:hypothetical protein